MKMNGALDLMLDTNLSKVSTLIAQLYNDRERIVSALAYAGGTHTFDDVAMMVLQGKFMYWPLENSCIIGEVYNYPQRKDLHFFISAGDLTEITAMQPQMIETAKALGCSSLSIAGRPGWIKPLGELGWKVHSTNLWLDLTTIQPDLFTQLEEENDHERRRQGRRDGNGSETSRFHREGSQRKSSDCG